MYYICVFMQHTVISYNILSFHPEMVQVYTVQYLVWYMALLPLALSSGPR